MLINIGFSNLVNSGRIVAVISPDSAPVKRLVQDSRELGRLIDASFGRSTKSIIVMDNGCLILSSLNPETIAARMDSVSEGA